MSSLPWAFDFWLCDYWQQKEFKVTYVHMQPSSLNRATYLGWNNRTIISQFSNDSYIKQLSPLPISIPQYHSRLVNILVTGNLCFFMSEFLKLESMDHLWRCCGHFNLSANAGCMRILYSGKTRQKTPKGIRDLRKQVKHTCSLYSSELLSCLWTIYDQDAVLCKFFYCVPHSWHSGRYVMRDAKICKSVC